MNLNNIDMKIRARTNWEAFDLGKVLLMKYKKAVYVPWLIACFCLALVVGAIFHNSPGWAWFIFWLLLPMCERIVLFVLSRAVFGDVPSWKESLKSWPAQLKSGLFSYNFIYRFFPNRSFYLPVWQLEGLKIKERSVRLRNIGFKASADAIKMGLIFYKIESLLIFAMIGFILMLVPEGLIDWKEVTFSAIANQIPDSVFWVFSAVSALILVAVRPIYVAGGFTLYLHRRMVLEGWDIELQFRSLAERLNKPARLAILFLTCCVLWAPNVKAQDNAKVLIEEIMQTEEFNTEKKVTIRVPIDEEKKIKEEEKEEDSDLSYLSGIATFIKYFFIVLMAAFLGWLLYQIFQSSRGLTFKSTKRKKLPPKKIMGMDITEETLPFDIAGEAEMLIKQGDMRAALSLLYRGSLYEILKLHELPLKESFTENDCLSSVKKNAPQNIADYFAELTQLWLLMAYAHQEPQSAMAFASCRNWRSTFQVLLPSEESES
ncbi:MAG: hypothetical protein HRT88_14685 [Lentisphaeraceae bacterium]|nr:hypothetical protein [Lentisphaeraceae bacterium]